MNRLNLKYEEKENCYQFKKNVLVPNVCMNEKPVEKKKKIMKHKDKPRENKYRN